MKAFVSRLLRLFRFNAQSFQSRIALSIAIAGVLMIAFAYLLIGRMVQVTKRNEAIASTYQPVKLYAYACFQAVNQMISILQNSVYAAEQRISSRTNEEILDLWEKKALAFNDSLQRMVARRTNEPELAVTYEAIADRLAKMDKLVKEAISINKKGQRRHHQTID